MKNDFMQKVLFWLSFFWMVACILLILSIFVLGIPQYEEGFLLGMTVVLNFAYVVVVAWFNYRIVECNERTARAEAILNELVNRYNSEFSTKE